MNGSKATEWHSQISFLSGAPDLIFHFEDFGKCRAFAVKVDTKRLPVFLLSGVDLYHHFRNDAFYDLYNLVKVRKTGKREVVLCQPLPQTLQTATAGLSLVDNLSSPKTNETLIRVFQIDGVKRERGKGERRVCCRRSGCIEP